MHIGIITSEFPPDIGGVETYAAEFAKGLARLGYQVSVFVHTQHPPITIPNIVLYPLLRHTRHSDKWVLKKYDVDAWHVMNAAHSWVTLETHKPVVVSIHGNDFLNPYPSTGKLGFSEHPKLWRIASFLAPLDNWLGKKLTAWQMRRSLPKTRVILSNSHYTESVFLKKYPGCIGKTIVASVGVSAQFLDKPITKIPQGVRHFLTVSRLSEPRKNVDKVLISLEKLKHEYKFSYQVIGEGIKKKELEKLAEKLGLSDRVEFSGRLPMEQIIDAMITADLFILPSSILPDSHEGFGIVYLEAAACGTPSLACRMAGAIEAIDDGVSGFFVDDPSVDNIYQGLKKYLDNYVAFDADNCRKFAQQFTWDKVVRKALPYYSKS